MQAISSIVFYKLESSSYVLSISFSVSYTEYSEFNYNLRMHTFWILMGLWIVAVLAYLKFSSFLKKHMWLPARKF
jgi:hypothetical protein